MCSQESMDTIWASPIGKWSLNVNFYALEEIGLAGITSSVSLE